MGGGGGGFGGGAVVGIVIVVVVVVVLVGFAATRMRTRRNRTDGPGPSAGAPPPDGGDAGAPGAPGRPESATSPTGAPWSHDDRPAIDSVRGTLFPGSLDPLTAAPGPGREGAGSGVGPQEGVAAITAHDPAFDLAAFVEAAQRCFFVVQEAWTDRKPEMSRQVMADGLWQQHRVQIKGYLDEHKRNVLGDLSVGGVDVVDAHSDASYDTIIVRIRAACSDYDVNDDGKVIRGNKRVEEWAEDWTFQRSSQATTQTGGGTLAQKCPNCGAPLDVDLAGVCPYCKAPVMSGRYDWVLARISQLG